jgi:serine/threonine protein kinase
MATSYIFCVTLGGTEYTCTETIQQGTLAECFKAVCPEGHHWFIKKYNRKVTGHELFKRYLEQQDRLIALLSPGSEFMASLHHQSVGFDYYQIMPWSEGKDLRFVLQMDRVRQPKIRMELAARLTRLLRELYERRIVHADIKPSNIWIPDPDGIDIDSMQVADFDAAFEKDRGLPWQNQRFFLTYRYAAPELHFGYTPTFESDVFSLGVTMWMSLFDRHPFDSLFTSMEGKAVIKGNRLGKFDVFAFQHNFEQLLNSSRLKHRLNQWKESTQVNLSSDQCDNLLRCLNFTPSARPDAAEIADAFA